MQDILERIDERLDYRDKAAQAHANRTIRNWVVGVLTVIGAPISFGVFRPAVPDTAVVERIEKLQKQMREDSNRLRRDLRSVAWVLLDVQSHVEESAAYLGAKLDRVSKRARGVRLPERESRKEVEHRLVKLLGVPIVYK